MSDNENPTEFKSVWWWDAPCGAFHIEGGPSITFGCSERGWGGEE